MIRGLMLRLLVWTFEHSEELAAGGLLALVASFVAYCYLA
jgi:hypothetical protein